MTDRAKRAAAVLVARGWGCHDAVVTNCPTCNEEAPKGARYCPNCGTYLAYSGDDTLVDLEAAIAAALGETK